MASQYIELPIASGGGGGGTPGGLNGQIQYNNGGSFGGFGSTDGTNVGLSGNLTLSALGTNGILATDVSSNVVTLPNWSYDPSALGGDGVTANLTTNPAPDSITNQFDSINRLNLNVIPTANTAHRVLALLALSGNIDPNNSGFNIGSGYNGGVTLLDAFGSFNGSGSVGAIRGLNLNLQLSGNAGGTVEHIATANVGYNLNSGVSATDSVGLGINIGHQAGSTMSGGVQGLTMFGNIDGAIGNFTATNFSISASGAMTNYNGVTLNPAITSTITNGAGAFFDFFNFNSGAHLAYYNSFSSNFNINSGVTVTGNATCAGLSPQIFPGASVTTFTGIQLSPSGGGTVTNLQGINIDLSNLNSTTQKQGININDGGLTTNANYDTQTYAASPGFLNMNGLGGLFHVKAGHPMTNTLILANSLSVSSEFEDNMGADPFGGFLGFTSMMGAMQTVVAIGKTVDTVNSLCVGVSVPTGVIPTDGGTITNMSNIISIGAQSSGGTLTVTNLYGFNMPSGSTALATNAWGIHIADAGADNWFKKNVVVGGSTGKATGAFQLDVTGAAKISGNIQAATMTPANGATGTFTTTDLKTVTVTNGIITSIV